MAIIDAQGAATQFSNISHLPFVRQLTLLLGLAASVALGVYIVKLSSTPDYAPLYGDLSASESSQIMDALDRAGVQYQLNQRTGMVSVPASEVHRTRLRLASEGLPRGDSRGFDSLYGEQQLGVSSFMEKARYDRAVEAELSRSISSLESIKSARVHLAMPKQSVFIRKGSSPEASVLLNLYAGRALSENQLAGIIHLVASSVPGLEAAYVSVVDQKGQLLSSQDQNEGFGISKEQFNYTRQLEQEYQNRIIEILSPLMGEQGIRAQVAADLDFTVTERTSEVYAPDASVRSEQLVEEQSSDQGERGVPGTLSNQPPADVVVAPTPADTPEQEEAAGPQRSSRRETRNYELDKTISHIREASGVINRLSVAVVLDYREQTNEEGVVERVPLPEEELARMTGLVREAVGFNEERGDTVNVINASFIPPEEIEPLPETPIWEQPWLRDWVKIALGGIGILLLIFGVLKPFLKSAATAGSQLNPSSKSLEQTNQESAEGDEAFGDEQVTLSGEQQHKSLPPAKASYEEQVNQAQLVAQQEPGRAVQVVRNWVQADG